MKTTRRNFIKTVASPVIAAPLILPSRVWTFPPSSSGVHNHYPLWRSYKEYGTGDAGDWGAHHIDIAQ